MNVKFRAIYKNNNEFSYFTFDEIKNEDGVFYDNYKNWCQYTGLKDQNNKEIYEGDIVNAKLVGEFKGPIVYDRGSFKIDSGRDINNRPYIYLEDWCQTNHRTVEIIGNTHENPELLEVKEWVFTKNTLITIYLVGRYLLKNNPTLLHG